MPTAGRSLDSPRSKRSRRRSEGSRDRGRLFNLERTRRENTITKPGVVLNYGFAKNWEAVGKFRVESSPGFEITDPGLFLKRVLKEGVLREKEGVSFERRQHPGPAAEHPSALLGVIWHPTSTNVFLDGLRPTGSSRSV